MGLCIKNFINKRYKNRTEEILLESDDNSPYTDKLPVKKSDIVSSSTENSIVLPFFSGGKNFLLIYLPPYKLSE